MPLNGMTIPVGGTIAVTGGTTRTFTLTGVKVTNGVCVADSSVTDFLVRPTVAASAKLPAKQSDGKYSKGRRKIVYTIPRALPVTGEIVLERFTGEIEWYPVGTNNVATLINVGSQLMSDPDTQSFLTADNLA